MGKTAREMNVLFREHGYLDGEPGNYETTPKGSQYASETSYERGTGGYSFYNASWDVRTWDEDVIDALNADIAAAASEPSADPELEEDADVETDVDGEPDVDGVLEFDDLSEPQPESGSWTPVVLVVAAVVLVGVAVSPPVRRWADEKAKPRAQRAWRTLTRRGEVEAPSSDSDPALDEAVDPADMLEIDVAEIDVPASDLE